MALPGSSSRATVRLLLKFVWTRLSYRFSLGHEMFGDGLLLESVVPLLGVTHYQGSTGLKLEWWSTEFADRVKSAHTAKAWSPAFVSDTESRS